MVACNAPAAFVWISYADGYVAHRQRGPCELGFGPFPSDVLRARSQMRGMACRSDFVRGPRRNSPPKERVFDEALGPLELTLKESIGAMA